MDDWLVQVSQKKKYSMKSTRHAKDKTTAGRQSRPPVQHDRDADESADNIIVILPAVSSSTGQNGTNERTRNDGGYDGPFSSDASSASSNGSHGAESDLPSENTSSTDMSNSLITSFRPTSDSSGVPTRHRTAPVRPARRPLERIISGSSC